MAQNITIMGASYSAVPGVQLPKTGGGTALFMDTSDANAVASDIAEGKTAYVNGSKVTGTASGGGGSTKNIQSYLGYDYIRSSTYTDTALTLTCAKTGTYNISWVGWRSTSNGTSGSRLLINETTEATYTSFIGTYGQNPTVSNVSLNEGDVVMIQCRARSSSYYMYVCNLIIEEQ